LNARPLFYNDAGALRALWRILIFCFATMAALSVAALTIGPIVAGAMSLVGAHGVTNEEWVMSAGLLGGTAISVRYVDKRSWSEVWLARDDARPSLLALGFLIGLFAIGVPTALLIAARWLRDAGGPPGSWIGAGFRVTLTLLPAALVEELMTRGYILSVLRDSWGWLWAVVATSVGFGLLHLSNNGANAESVGLVTLAGFFLAAVVWATRSLYAAWMAHFAWNWTMAVLFHVAVSGYPMEAPGYRYVDAGPDWATGGAWGPEGGVPAALGMLAGVVVLFSYRRASQTTSSRATVLQES
jgi:membrane protease YdiL (CAAX protease family)